MKTIKLTKNKIALVDDEDYKILNEHKWYAIGEKYAARDVYKNGKKITFYMHRVIMNTSKNLQVDHIDGNGFNNQKENLRNCNRFQNMANQRTQKRDKTSKYKGVSFYTDKKKWVVKIEKEGKRYNGGRFKNEKEAAEAYNELATKLFGKYAKLNEV